MLQDLIRNHLLITGNTPRDYHRLFTKEIDWSSKVVGVTGPRGVGKSTLLIQRYWEEFADPNRCLYVSADHLSMANVSLFKLAEEFFGLGGEALIIDEVHRALNWQKQVKSIIDTFRDKRLWLSGSSSAELTAKGADLSRRVPWYHMPGLSFREYLAFSQKRLEPVYSFEQILTNHTEMASALKKDLPILQLFNQYLNHGYYPFFLEGLSTFEMKVHATVEKVLHDDIPAVFQVNPSSVIHLKRLLLVIASSKPYEPNVEGLASDLGIARDTVYHFLDCLEKAKLIRRIKRFASGAKSVRKPAKILLENANILSAICGRESLLMERGSLRETFLASQLPTLTPVSAGSSVDFIVRHDIGIEVGGPNKNGGQFTLEKTKNITTKVIAQDGIEVGSKGIVPLYLFGFLR